MIGTIVFCRLTQKGPCGMTVNNDRMTIALQNTVILTWHVITLQEASEYVDHDILTGRFHVTHYAGCVILFNKDTFYPNIDVKSIYFHDTRRHLPDQVMEGEQ